MPTTPDTTGAGVLDLLEDGARGKGTIRFVPEHPEPMPLGGLWDRAARAGVSLLDRVGSGGTVALRLASTPDAVAVLIGAWRAGLTVVSLPHPVRHATATETRAGVQRICEMTGAALVVADRLTDDLEGATVPACRFADVADARSVGVIPDVPGSFVQFTSGSSGNPKGVRLSLRAIARNVCSIIDAVDPGPGTTFCSWLPLSHDMGLIGQCLTSLSSAADRFVGQSHLCLIATEAFQANPSIWLRTCSEIGATHSAVPNLGLELAARFLARTGSIDLTSMVWCGCGAEPVRAETLRAFTAAAGPFGFRPSALSPCYGLAEASLAVTMVRPSEPWTTRSVDREELARRRWVEVGTDGADGDEVVAVGPPIKDMAVRVDRRAGEDVGHIEISGPSLLTGYLGAPSPFTADGWLRTGDEGAVGADGELYVLGRTDDVIVLRGRNLYVIELEEAAGAHRMIRAGNCAVIPDGDGRYVLIAERRSRLATDEALREAAVTIRRELAKSYGVGPSAVVFVPAGALPRTTSGKVQRHRLRQAEREGALPAVFEMTFGGATRDGARRRANGVHGQ